MRNKSKHLRRCLLAFVLFLNTIFLSGCWSTNEVDDLAIINMMAIDENESGDVVVTVAVIIPENIYSRTSTAGIPGEGDSVLLTATGKNIFEAIGKLSGSISKRIYLGHINTIIFGERAARERMETSLDFFRRENDFRPNIKLLVTNGKAKDILKMGPMLEPTLGLDLDRLIRLRRFSPMTMVKDLSSFLEDLTSDTKDPITGLIVPANENGVDTEKKGSENAKDTGKNRAAISDGKKDGVSPKKPLALSLQGTAAFKGGHLKGFLTHKETRGLLWIQGEIKNGIVILDCGKNQQGTVALQIRDSQSRFIPERKNGAINMMVNIEVEADVGEIACKEFKIKPDDFDRLNAQLEDHIRKEANLVLNKAQKEWQTDIFGFGEALYRKYPKEWEKLAPQWREGELRKLKVNLEIKTNISRYGLIENPSRSNESR
ncbi:Ger(x)C family spore germination protein [Alkalihalobacillus sp. AL-G]|uniref:Ger(x)C family spore germination protein n=1 Tax=Alkalihalobacillus sp. AL-G TaxID=2926399 RepID=UPI00272B53F8|nr:Ger(x)C family spore germination protein [Alkalihalobacillus sp. AL-G]WLD93759.1 Ger(x)C family spore germination protein [Alkalihalobacillus sp. AL-G]